MADTYKSATRPAETAAERTRSLSWVWDLLLVGILLLGGALRLVGLDWDQSQHLHPDERFLTMVETSIQAPSLSEYFNTTRSTFNPHNVGHTFFVYGTLPIFIVYHAGQLTGMSGYDSIYLVGRALSALMDLGTIVLVFLIANRLYRRTRIGLLAAAFLALAVLPIQLSHFFAVDTFLTFFIYLAVYFAAQVLTTPADADIPPPEQRPPAGSRQALLLDRRSLWPYALFGIALGCAMASKVSSLPLAGLLPLAAWIQWTRLDGERRAWQAPLIWRNLVLAGAIAFITFRIFQPYAFSGPGFFGLLPNQLWLRNLQELSGYVSGEVDFPPALQWARRPLWFSWQNMVIWGLGLPLGLAAWAGFLWMGWRMLKGEWRQHLLLWSWTGIYFAWQSIGFTRSMRYQLPIYPALAIMAAWLIVTLWEKRRAHEQPLSAGRRRFWAGLSIGLGAVVLLGTFAWAFAFSRIYTRPHSRVQASEWIYQNIPGPLTLEGTTPGGQPFRLPTSVSSERMLELTAPIGYRFTAQYSGSLEGVRFEQLSDPFGQVEMEKTLALELKGSRGESLASGWLACDFLFSQPEIGCASPYTIYLDRPVMVEAGQNYELSLRMEEPGAALRFSGAPLLQYMTEDGFAQQALPDFGPTAEAGKPLSGDIFTANRSGTVERVTIPRLFDLTNAGQEKTIRLDLFQMPDIGSQIASGTISGRFDPEAPAQAPLVVDLQPAAEISAGRQYMFQITIESGEGSLAVYAVPVALETSWDDPLPLPLNGLSPYPSMYRGGLNFEMYYDDDASKLARFTSTLDQAEYLFMTSNRQWGTTVRVPERYPLTTEYYRSLMGCPAERDVFWCYAVAEPGMFSGQLGYELVYSGTSYPNLGSIRFNSQFAEEAFSVYDHPKVMIFRKTDAYSPVAVREILGRVDLGSVVRLTPAEAGGYKGDLTLPQARLAEQRSGGTWSELFPSGSLLNRSQPLAAAVWYLAITLLGWIVYPLTRLAFTGFADRGYPFSRLAGLLLFALLAWWAGSLGIPVQRWLLALVVLILAAAGAAAAFWRRADLAAELRQNRRTIAWVEVLALAAFVLFLLVRLGNPDLWHPYHGGEKPMDLAYLNAVMKSTTFPPYDPWYAGGYINYYYYGFVLVGMPVKLLGIDPAVAYNLILPTLFSICALGAYSIVWNLARSAGEKLRRRAVQAGLAGAAVFLLLGNLGTVRMLWNGFQMLATNGAPVTEAPLLQRWAWTFAGAGEFLAGEKMPYGPGDWYWKPSRAIQPEAGNEITEFPAFTFLYADLHAHMMALPVTLFALAWALSTWLNRWRWAGPGERPSRITALVSIFLAAAAVGSLRAINTWDLPVFLVLAAAALAASAIMYGPAHELLPGLRGWQGRVVLAVGSVLLLAALAVLLYLPFGHWYGQGYTSVDLQDNWRTPIPSYLVHWGLFLFVLASWIFWEARDWMEKTPVSALRRLQPYQTWIRGFFLALLALFAALLLLGVSISWLALPLAAASGLLLLRPGQPAAKRAALVMAASALVLTLVVEVVVLQGDINRMNTVFKFYLQAWTLLSLSSAAALYWLLPAVQAEWRPAWSFGWQAALALLVGSAALFPLTAGYDKMNTRISAQAPNTLDGSSYMRSATYWDFDKELPLAVDYAAIRWLQQNVPGSPVIVEGHTVEYHWGNRYSINTGLPMVVGYQWHQIQQRALLPAARVVERVDAVNNFYLTTDTQQARDFLSRYEVRYIIVGPLEKAKYAGPGLEKFSQLEGDAWRSVYDQDGVAIYEVSES